MTRYQWARWGDINAFFGLMLDNVAVLIALVVLTTSTPNGFSREFVLNQMIPGSAIGVLVGDLVYTWLAFRLARRTSRDDVTAMPLGLDTPSTIAVGPLVLLPALLVGMRRGYDHEKAMFFAWHVGAVVLILSGLFKTLAAPLGSLVRRFVPRAGLLGSLAAIAITLIAFVPMWQQVAAVPLVGMVSLTVILVALVAHREMPGKIPGALVAVVAGAMIFHVGAFLGPQINWHVVPEQVRQQPVSWNLPELLPTFAHNIDWWREVFVEALKFLPIMLPFALATIVGGIDCTESAAAAGDEYDTRAILLTEGAASVIAGLCGGVLQNTPYIGQPAYKALGGRAAYTFATAIFIGVAGCLGWFAMLFEWLPEPAMFPILVFVGLEITAQSFKATPPRHYPALALAAIPALAYMATIAVDMALGERLPTEQLLPVFQALRCLANGFIITSLLWASALAAILDGRLRLAALFLFVAGVFSLAGIIHSPLNPGQILWPQTAVNNWYAYYWNHWAEVTPALKCQSPYHWAAAYGISAIILLGLSFQRTQNQSTVAA
ncbi:MAG: SulP family inorganic anion transporter [Planctomycetes bacterium]|nr:SulP family inorganic anion transporter [Planctomycetota bacterium]